MNYIRFSLSNNEDKELFVFIEPWCHEIYLKKNEFIDVTVKTEEQNIFEIIYEKELVTIFFHPKVSFRIDKNGKTILEIEGFKG